MEHVQGRPAPKTNTNRHLNDARGGGLKHHLDTPGAFAVDDEPQIRGGRLGRGSRFSAAGETPESGSGVHFWRAGEDPILRHGIQDHMVFLEKPFTMVELVGALNKAREEAPDP